MYGLFMVKMQDCKSGAVGNHDIHHNTQAESKNEKNLVSNESEIYKHTFVTHIEKGMVKTSHVKKLQV